MWETMKLGEMNPMSLRVSNEDSKPKKEIQRQTETHKSHHS